MTRRSVNPPPTGMLYDRLHFSQATRVGDTIWVSGQVGIDVSTMTPADGMDAQARLAFEGVRAALEAGERACRTLSSSPRSIPTCAATWTPSAGSRTSTLPPLTPRGPRSEWSSWLFPNCWWRYVLLLWWVAAITSMGVSTGVHRPAEEWVGGRCGSRWLRRCSFGQGLGKCSMPPAPRHRVVRAARCGISAGCLGPCSDHKRDTLSMLPPRNRSHPIRSAATFPFSAPVIRRPARKARPCIAGFPKGAARR